MNSLLKLLPLMLRLAGDNAEVREQAAFAAWRAASGAGVASGCAPFRLYRKHLVIAVLDQIWKQQMEQISGEYLFRLNSVLGAPLVTFIEFRIDRQYVLQARPPETKLFEFHHTAEIAAALQPSAAVIKDESLRAQFLRAAAKCLERRGD